MKKLVATIIIVCTVGLAVSCDFGKKEDNSSRNLILLLLLMNSSNRDTSSCTASTCANVRFRNYYTGTRSYALYTQTSCGGTQWSSSSWNNISYYNSSTYVYMFAGQYYPGYYNAYPSCSGSSTPFAVSAGSYYTITEYSTYWDLTNN